MSETKYTKGPWHIETYESEPDRPFICASWGVQDPVVNEFSDIWPTDVVMANAVLCAAAPDMLEALILSHGFTFHDMQCQCVKGGPECTCGLLDADKRIDAAIARATGGAA